MLRQSIAGIELQERDFAILRGLFECRVLTTAHIAQLYFEGRRESAKKRIQKLKSTRLLAERSRRQFEPAIHFLTRNGLSVLNDRGILALYPEFSIPTLARRAHVSEMTLRHELAVIDLKVAFHTATLAHNISLLEFNTWPLLNQFKVLGDVVKPDAFVRIRETTDDGQTQEHSFYIELDRSTEPISTLCDRARGYTAYCRSGRFALERGFSLTESHKHPFRVLYVACSTERRDNVARRLLSETPPILSLVWLATLSEATTDPFSPIWVRPIDYKTQLQTGALTPQCINRAPGQSRQANLRPTTFA